MYGFPPRNPLIRIVEYFEGSVPLEFQNTLFRLCLDPRVQSPYKVPVDAQHQLLKLISTEFESRRQKNNSYSLRAFSRDLNIPPSALSEILNGKRGITKLTGKKVLSKLALDSEQALNLFKNLKPRNPRGLADSAFTRLNRQTFQVIADWHYFAILSLMETDSYVDRPRWIAKRLGLTLTVASEALDTLERLELISRDSQGRRITTGKQFIVPDDKLADLAKRRHHHQSLSMASRALEEVATELREFGNITIAADTSRLKEAKERLKNFRLEICSLLEGGAQKNEVYRFSVQLFPLSRRGKKSYV